MATQWNGMWTAVFAVLVFSADADAQFFRKKTAMDQFLEATELYKKGEYERAKFLFDQLDGMSGNAPTTIYFQSGTTDKLWGTFSNIGTNPGGVIGTNSSGTVTWYETDIRNSIVATFTTNIFNRRRYTYDTFGNPSMPLNGGLMGTTFVGYTGKLYNTNTGLQYNSNRFYNPAIGRWMSQDPTGFSAGDMNLYRYVGNNPSNFTDPRGTSATLVGAGIGAAVGFLAGGLTGAEGLTGWSLDRALAGAGSGALVGAGVGLMVDTFGASAPGSMSMIAAGMAQGALIGAGMTAAGQGNLFQAGAPVNWNGYGRGLATGAVSGAASGLVAGGLAGVMSSRGMGMLSTQFASNTLGAVVGGGGGQQLAVSAGWQDSIHWDQVGMAGVGGALGAVAMGALTRGMIYSAGENAGRIICGTSQSAWMAGNIVGGMGGALAGDALHQGYDYLTCGDRANWRWNWGQTLSSVAIAGVTSATAAQMMWKYAQACFVEGTLTETLEGWKPVEEVIEGVDRLMSVTEHDPYGPLEYKLVEKKFVLLAQVYNLCLEGGRIIGTTLEHPFYKEGKGWTPCGKLELGDRIWTKQQRWVKVEGVVDTHEIKRVYNFRIADFATYFVGGEDWEFSVWAHNSYQTELDKFLATVPEEHRAGVKDALSLYSQIRRPPGDKQTALAKDHPETFMSGETRKIAGFADPEPLLWKVRELALAMDHPLPSNGILDHVFQGSFYAGHAEKFASLQSNVVATYPRAPCGNCGPWFENLSIYRQMPHYVADAPNRVRVYSNGQEQTYSFRY